MGEPWHIRRAHVDTQGVIVRPSNYTFYGDISEARQPAGQERHAERRRGPPADGDVQAAAVARIDLTDLWGITSRLAARLIALGIKTPLDLRDADPQFMRERFSVVMERMTLELRGTP